jgi:3-hydroxyisobutyrate dehydrogenase-like beta-hydroxyacid dehydrogenase
VKTDPMNQHRELNIPPAALELNAPLQTVLRAVLYAIDSVKGVRAIVLGGSIAGNARRTPGDADLWVFVDDVSLASETLKNIASSLPNLTLLYDAGHLPWFGYLLTFLFYPGCTSAVDVGLAKAEDALRINTGPGAVVLWSRSDAKSILDIALQRRRFRSTPAKHAESVLMNLVKLNKAIDRGEKWGALEYVSRARREVIGILRDAHPAAVDWYERPDREIEGLLTDDQREGLSATHCQLDGNELAAAGRALARLTLRYGGNLVKASVATALRQVAMRLSGVDPMVWPRVGVVGTGRMGSPITRHMVDLGLDVYFVEPNLQRAEIVSTLGAKLTSVTELLERVDVVLFALPDPRTTQEMLTLVLRSDVSRRVLVNLSTNTPETACSFAEHCAQAGHGFLDAPMSGGTWGAREGRLTLMVGGDESDLSLARPVLSAFASQVVHVGPVGSGCAAKLLHNMVGELEVQAFAEAFCVGSRMGVDAASLFECLSGGMAASRVLTKLYGEGVRRGTDVNVPIDIAEQDQRLLLDMVRRFGIQLTWTEAVHKRLQKLQADGFGTFDVSNTLRWFESHHRVAVKFNRRISPVRDEGY